MKKILAIVSVMMLSTGLKAQDTGMLYDRSLSFALDINLPMTNTDYIKSATAKGLRIGYRERMSDGFYMGVDFNYAGYSDYAPRQTYYNETGAVTTDFYKYASSFGATLSGEYQFRSDKRVMPFVGLGAGVTYNSYKVFYNIFEESDSGWGFLLRPEAGAIVKFGKRGVWGLVSSVHFDYATVKSDKFSYQNFTNLGLRTGLVFWIGSGSPF